MKVYAYFLSNLLFSPEIRLKYALRDNFIHSLYTYSVEKVGKPFLIKKKGGSFASIG